MNWPRCRPSLLSGLAETWWNSSTAISRSSNASTPNLSTAKRKVACVHTSTLSSLSRKAPTELIFPPSEPGALQRFHFGETVQSAQNPNSVSLSSLKLAAIAAISASRSFEIRIEECPFISVRFARADDPCRSISVGVDNAGYDRPTDQTVAPLPHFAIVSFVFNRKHRSIENRGGFLEAD